MHSIKYLLGYTIPLAAWISINYPEQLAFFCLLYAFVFIPLLELLIPAAAENHSPTKEQALLSDKGYDIVLYLALPIHLFILWFFLESFQQTHLTLWQRIGMISAAGICNGVLGINVAHELGHRIRKSERWMAQLLLSSSLYAHFYIEHNRGHHKYVGTPHDPATAKLGQSLYAFWWQSLKGTYLSAWRIELDLLRKNKQAFLSIRNGMLWQHLFQMLILVAVFHFYGSLGLAGFVAAALFGILLLETINYIEHYGLVREKNAQGAYQKVEAHHSWNADQVIGRLMLFELTRHADHHYKASRKYQILRHLDKSPQLPTGYPGMMLLSLIPPLFFKVMNNKVMQHRSQEYLLG